MSGSDAELQELAGAAGVSVEWRNFAGEPRVVSPDALRAILRALEIPCDSREDIADARNRLRPVTGLRGLPPLVTASVDTPLRLAIGDEAPKSALLLPETGGSRDIRLHPAHGGATLPIISEPGYHRLLVGEREIVLAIAPAHGVTAGDLAPAVRPWGIAAQVYGLRRNGDGGIGDAEAVAQLAEAAAARGADMLALSPVHALFTAEPHRFGPYSPSSRLFLNPLHAAPGMLFSEERVRRAAAEAGVAEQMTKLEKLDLIDWPEASKAKLALLRALFAQFIADDDVPTDLHADFSQFEADGGALLSAHACFEALQAEALALNPAHGDWRRWPADLRDPRSPTVAAFARANRREVLFHIFLQWVADRSLGQALHRAQQAGMRIGLIADLAVGMDPAGSHAWSSPEDILGGLSVGAPPDLFNPNGQQWGITSFAPAALRRTGFTAFLETVRAALRNAGGVRIDHAMGLQRLWLVPDGASPADGAYLNYPLPDLLRLLALESYRHRAIVVGEDLGTVPEHFREQLEGHGVYGMRVLWFEREDADFTEPSHWDRAAMAMTSTHDLPTAAGWWTGSDIALRAAHGVLGRDHRREDVEQERDADRGSLWRAFSAAQIVSVPPPREPEPFVDAALRFVAATGSELCLLPLEDVLGEVDQPNLPGTTDEHPNWRRRTPSNAAGLLDGPEASRRLAAVSAKRKPS